MPDASAPARTEAYADALFEVARAEGTLGEVEDELFRFARTFEGNDELRMALSDRALPADRRVAVVEELLGEKALQTSMALASFVVSSGRAGEFSAIVDRFVELAAAERKQAIAEVRSAIPLDEQQTFAGEDEEVFLVGLRVVHPAWLSGRDHRQSEAHIAEPPNL